MDAEVHRRIAETIAAWLRLPSGATRALCEGSEAPDRLPDYDVKPYLTTRGRIGVRKTRIPHHATPPRLIKRTITQARQIVLKSEKLPVGSEANWLSKLLRRTRGDRLSDASYILGRALHYIQDNTVFPYSEDSYTHDLVERGCRRLDPSSCVEKTELHRPIGKMETYEEIESIEPADNSSETMRRATKHSFAVASSVLSSSQAPPKLNTLGNDVYRFFKIRQIPLLLISILLFLVTNLSGSALDEEAAFVFGLLVGLPSICLSLLGFGVALLTDINAVLRLARWTYPVIICLGAGTTVTVLLLRQFGPIMPFLLITSFHLLFLWHPAWGPVRNNVYWFDWALAQRAITRKNEPLQWRWRPRAEIKEFLRSKIHALKSDATYRTLLAETATEFEFIVEQVEKLVPVRIQEG